MHIHLIAFDVPYPPNYGGVMDIYFKIKTLSENDISVSLHCFDYGRGKQEELNKVCKEVFYYPRKSGLIYQFSYLPYITLTRNHKQLLGNLLKDNSPILFEGLHCCFLLPNKSLSHRKKIVRMHNIEHDYYNSLAKAEKNIVKKIYFKLEAKKLKWFEKNLACASAVMAISPNDRKYLSLMHKNVQILPPFHPFKTVTSKIGKSNYSLYHGNLSVPENNEAALYLTNKIYNNIDAKLIIAGNFPSKELIIEVKKYNNIELLPNVSTKEILKLVADAHINILPTFQTTGIKLKLLVALYTGRFCLVNNQMVENTGLENLCVVAQNEMKMKEKILILLKEEFSAEFILKRNLALNQYYSNDFNFKQIYNELKNSVL